MADAYSICPASGKRRFRSKRAAKQQAKYCTNKLTVYFCLDCRGYHVSNADRFARDVVHHRHDKVRHRKREP